MQLIDTKRYPLRGEISGGTGSAPYLVRSKAGAIDANRIYLTMQNVFVTHKPLIFLKNF